MTIKGSKRIENLQWREYKNGIYVAQIPKGLTFDQLFINGEQQIRVRFPNYDYQNPLRGGEGYQQVTGGTNHRYDTWFSFNPAIFTNKEWKNPTTGIVHAFQSHNWGNMQYRIKEVNRTENKVYLNEGGWQLQRNHGVGGSKKGASWFFIDNIFEELDVAGEWFLDTPSNLLYYYPKEGVKLNENGNQGAVIVILQKNTALLINIADDPDLIDATGGYNYGCYIKSLDPNTAKMWTDAQLDKDWVIQQVNEKKVNNIAGLQKLFTQFKGQKVTITAARDYNFKKFEVQIKL